MKFEIRLENTTWDEVWVNLYLWDNYSIIKHMSVAFWKSGECHLMTERKSVILSRDKAIKAMNGFISKYNK